MAFVQQGRYAFTVIDELGVGASFGFYVLFDNTQTVDQCLFDLQAFATLLAAVCGGEITRQELVVLDVPTARTTPAVGSRVEQTALLTLNVPSSIRPDGQAVPALLDSVIAGGKIDLTPGGAAANLIAALVGSSASAEFATLQYIPLAGGSLRHAGISFRKRRRTLNRTSGER